MHLAKPFGMGAALLALIALCPISHAEEAKTTGSTTWIGVSVRPLSDGLRQQWDYRGAGVMVTAVAPGSPAELAGIVRGDVLVVIGSVSLKSESDFAEAQSRVTPGDPVSVVIAREKGRLINIVNLDVTPEVEEIPTPAPLHTSEARPEPAIEKASTVPAVVQQAAPRVPFGVRGETLSPHLAAALAVPVEQGVIVLAVVDGSPAALAGIRPGDVVSRAAGQAISSSADLERVLSDASATTLVRIHRQREERDVEVRFEVAPPAQDVQVDRDAERDREIQQLRAKVRELRSEIQRLRTELEGMKSL